MALTDQYAVVSFSGELGSTNGTTPVTMISHVVNEPNIIIDKEGISILNRDTVSATVTLTITGTPDIVYETVTLASGDKYTNPSRISLEDGQTLTIVLSGAVTTNELTWVLSDFRITN